MSQYLLVCGVSALNVAEVLIIQEKIYTKATQNVQKKKTRYKLSNVAF